jgi:hypothetical protein
MLTIVNNVIHVDLLVQAKRRVSFMYFCTHENINVFISNPNCNKNIFNRKLYLLTFLLETDILVYCMLGLEINVVL